MSTPEQYTKEAYEEAEYLVILITSGYVGPGDTELVLKKLHEVWADGYGRGYADHKAGWAETPQASNPYEEKK